MHENEHFLTEYDLHLWSEGSHHRAWEKMGAHLIEVDGTAGTRFAVWAPNARSVSVIGDFNGWDEAADMMNNLGNSGIWELFIPRVAQGALYKYVIHSQWNDYQAEKADPFGFSCEIRPQTASKVWDISGYDWGDADWMAHRRSEEHTSELQSH